MKTILLSVLTLGAFVSEAAAQQPAVGPGAVKFGRVEAQGIKTPEYQIAGGPQKRSKIGTWLEVEVPYETKVDDVDELTFNFMIMVDNVICDGNVTYINIPKGRDHYAVMYIAPRSLEKLTGGRALTGADIQNVWVTVLRQGQILDGAVYKVGQPAHNDILISGVNSLPTSKLAQNVIVPSYTPAQPPNLPHQTGLVLNKNETPFKLLFYDRYEAIKVSR